MFRVWSSSRKGGLSGPERRGRNTPAEQARLVRSDLADSRDHSFDVAIFNFYFGVKENPDGSFKYDISALARTLDYWKTLGSATPVAHQSAELGRRNHPAQRENIACRLSKIVSEPV